MRKVKCEKYISRIFAASNIIIPLSTFHFDKNSPIGGFNIEKA